MNSDLASANTGTTPVRDGFGFDVAGLDGWMKANIEDYAGPLTVEQFRGGMSNPTYQLTTPAGRYVLRRKPPGETLRGAHAVDREARVQQSLGAAGFPVARVHGLCTDDAVIGSWFYVMDMVEGRICWDAAFGSVPREDRPAYFDAMNAVIAQLHSLDRRRSGWGTTAIPATISHARSRDGASSTSATRRQAATPPWMRWSRLCPARSPRQSRPRSFMAIFAATT